MKYILSIVLVFQVIYLSAQNNQGYQQPSKPILDLVDIELAPGVMMNQDKSFMVFTYRNAYKTIEELSEEEMRLGGLRINPKTNIGSRTNYVNNVKVKNMQTKDQRVREIEGLPSNPRLANFSWSPDQTKIACTNTTTKGVELWVVDLHKSNATKLTEANVNANTGDVINWFEDGQSVLVKMLPKERGQLINTASAVPTGPTVSVSDGKKAQNRTYQDLLQNKNDEHNFKILATSEIHRVSLDGKSSMWLPADMYRGLTFSPDGSYVMVSIIEEPFSYLVPYRRFPSRSIIYGKRGKAIQTVLEVPLIEDLPKGFMSARKGRRDMQWRGDKAHTLVFAEVLDGGDPEVEVPFRDEVFELDAPFNGEPRSVLKTINRFSGIQWGTDKIAIAYDYWWNSRNTKTYTFNPSKSNQEATVIIDRNYQDSYSDPGSFVTTRNKFGSSILVLDGDNAMLMGDGFTDEGQFPFVDKLNITTGTTKRVYQSKYTDKIEDIRDYNTEKNQLLVRIESKNDFPNYYLRDLKSNKLTQITEFQNPFAAIQDVHKEVITYQREDGLELTGTLYLPVGYDEKSKEKMPMILWAYPREYKDKSSASQNTSNPNEFTYPFWGSPIYWVNKGYVVLADAAFPIVGEGDDEPNDTFRKQLVDNAKAAIDAVDEMGYIDRKRIAVGGHSYGAFMVANLLSHSDLFAAGIARSGAYNRTLTPFGFQSEERSYWEAPDVYNTMSPFMHADKMKTPLLLVHGEADNNSGTYPLQSKRYFNALKGLGATVRLVMLPKESHGYRAKESILHLLWEQDQWLDKHVKNKIIDQQP